MSNNKTVEDKFIYNFEKLSTEHKKEARDFVLYLKAQEELSATKEILNDDDFIESIIRGDEDFRKGRFKKWSEVKKDV